MSMPSNVITTLLNLCDSPEEAVKVAALKALGEGQAATAQVLEKVISLLSDDNVNVSVAAVEALGRMYRNK